MSNMDSVMESHKPYLTSLTADFQNVTEEKHVVEGDIRRSQIMFSDRKVHSPK